MSIELQGNVENAINEMLEGSVAGNIKLLGSAPTINELNVSNNGTYETPEGVDGFNPVIVNVPERVPIIERLNINANGTYEVGEGVDGFNPVVVNVPERVPIIERLNINANGTYEVGEGVDGFNPVVVNVPTPIIASNNGTVKLVISNGHLLFRFDGYYQANQDWSFSDAFDNPLITEFLNKFPTHSMDAWGYDANGVKIGYIGFYNNRVRSWNLDDTLAPAGLTWYSIYDFTNSSREQYNEYTPW